MFKFRQLVNFTVSLALIGQNLPANHVGKTGGRSIKRDGMMVAISGWETTMVIRVDEPYNVLSCLDRNLNLVCDRGDTPIYSYAIRTENPETYTFSNRSGVIKRDNDVDGDTFTRPNSIFIDMGSEGNNWKTMACSPSTHTEFDEKGLHLVYSPYYCSREKRLA